MSELPKYVSLKLRKFIPCWLIHFLWFMWSDIPMEQRGSQQIFYLSNQTGEQQIRLVQSTPPYERKVCLSTPDPLDAAVIITKTATGITMHLTNEPR